MATDLKQQVETKPNQTKQTNKQTNKQTKTITVQIETSKIQLVEMLRIDWADSRRRSFNGDWRLIDLHL